MGFQFSRSGGVMYGQSSDGRIKVQYPVGDRAKVEAMLMAAEIMCPQDEQLTLTSEVAPQVRPGQTEPAAHQPEKRKHRVAKKLKNDDGSPFVFSDWVAENVSASPNGRRSVDEILKQIGHHYDNDRAKLVAALRVAAMQTQKFSLAGDTVLAKTASVPKLGNKRGI